MFNALVDSLFCYALLCVHSRFAFILKRKRKLVALLLLSYRCIVTINVLWLFLTVSWVVLQCVIVVFPDRTAKWNLHKSHFSTFITWQYRKLPDTRFNRYINISVIIARLPNGQMLNRWFSEKNNLSVVRLRFRGAKKVKKCCMFCIL